MAEPARQLLSLGSIDDDYSISARCRIPRAESGSIKYHVFFGSYIFGDSSFRIFNASECPRIDFDISGLSFPYPLALNWP